MKCLVPLAGPDVYHAGIKPLLPVRGQPLVETAIKSRLWWQCGALRAEDIIFVLRQQEDSCSFLRARLEELFAGASFVTLSRSTGGALLTAMAAASLVEDLNEIICVDLVDILYDMEISPVTLLGEGLASAAAPFFLADHPKFSYFLPMGPDQPLPNIPFRVADVQEKCVISPFASAGTYFFRNVATMMEAFHHALQAPHRVSVGGALFVAPSLSFLAQTGQTVLAVPVRQESVCPISLSWKNSSS